MLIVRQLVTTCMENGCSPGCPGNVFDGVFLCRSFFPFSHEMSQMRSGT